MALAPTEFPAETISLASGASRSRATFWSRFLRHRLAQSGLAIIVVLLLVFAFAEYISPVDPMRPQPRGIDEYGVPHAPGAGFLLGADTQGRDIWTRTLYGTRISLTVGICAMLTAMLIGTTVGLLSGYFGGWVDVVLMRVTESVMSLPTILLAIALAEVLPGEGFYPRLFKLLLAIGLVTWTGIARAVRGQVLSLKEREFVEAARAVGCSSSRIVWVHLLPNVMPTVIVLATLATAHTILLEAGLSYLGVGADPSAPSWGAMIKDGQSYMLSAPWIFLAPGVAIILAVAAFNLLGQGLQETLEPRR
ncbi:MAG TPA: ABC transporter permease [Abditibacteriaceae bacterium]|nr:ABC transporter permease [Abditibacteriaceae bacterium]